MIGIWIWRVAGGIVEIASGVGFSPDDRDLDLARSSQLESYRSDVLFQSR